MSRVTLHLVCILHYYISLVYDYFYVDYHSEDAKNEYFTIRGRLRFLTLWNMIIQAAFFTICLLNDVIGTNEETPKKKPAVRIVKDTMLAALAFPLSMLVGLTFWILYAIDRELIFPKALDEFFPAWLNHAMHTNIMIFILIEMFSSFRKYPKRKTGVAILATVLLMYVVWIHIINAYSGVWVYPFLGVLNLPLRIAFFVIMTFIGFGVYVLGEKLNAMIWAKTLKAIEKKA